MGVQKGRHQTNAKAKFYGKYARALAETVSTGIVSTSTVLKTITKHKKYIQKRILVNSGRLLRGRFIIDNIILTRMHGSRRAAPVYTPILLPIMGPDDPIYKESDATLDAWDAAHPVFIREELVAATDSAFNAILAELAYRNYVAHYYRQYILAVSEACDKMLAEQKPINISNAMDPVEMPEGFEIPRQETPDYVKNMEDVTEVHISNRFQQLNPSVFYATKRYYGYDNAVAKEAAGDEDYFVDFYLTQTSELPLFRKRNLPLVSEVALIDRNNTKKKPNFFLKRDKPRGYKPKNSVFFIDVQQLKNSKTKKIKLAPVCTVERADELKKTKHFEKTMFAFKKFVYSKKALKKKASKKKKKIS